MSSSNKDPSASGDAAKGPDSQNTIGHYVLGKALGEGTFGKVMLGKHILTGEKVSTYFINDIFNIDFGFLSFNNQKSHKFFSSIFQI